MAALSLLGSGGRRAGDLIAGRRGVALTAAELLGLTALAIAQPILDGLKRSTFAFPTVKIGGWDLAVLAALLILVPPALLLAVELIAGLVSRVARGWVHLAWVGLLVALLCWQAVAQGGESSAFVRVVIPAIALIAAVILYLRFDAARSLCRILGFAAPVIAGLFLFTSPIVDFTFAANPDIPDPQVKSSTPVVLIVLDEFPLAALLDSQGGIDAKRFPNFAALQEQSDWFRNTRTVADSTEQAVPAILSGDFPKPNGVATYTDHPDNLFTLLGSSYPTNISESETHLCPPGICPSSSSLVSRLAPVLGEGLSTASTSFPFNLAGKAATELNRHYPLGHPPQDQVETFLHQIKAPPQGGSLNMIHVELPHVPWRYTPSGKTYETGTYPLGISSETWSRSPGYVIQGLQRELLQLQYTDRVLGVIVQSLRNYGLYEKAMVAVVADHGAAFIPGQSRRLVSRANAGWILRVPLFIKLPGQRRGRIISRPVRTIDLLPAIADVLGIHIPWHVDGRSLLGRPSRVDLNTYMSYRENILHIPPSVASRGFFSALAVRNGFLGHGDIYTLGASRAQLRGQLRAASPIDVSVQSPGGTTADPKAGFYPSLIYGSILSPGVGDGDSLIAKMNGRIVAVGQSVNAGTGFILLIPPEAFRPGENRLQLYAR